MRFRRRRALEIKPDESNMTPMIDVVFQLLIFFMLSMHFKEVEGKLLSQLPKTKGPASAPVPKPELEEVRVVLCAGGDWATHLADKGKHEKGAKNGAVCRALVARLELGELHSSESQPARAASNRDVYRRVAAQAREFHAQRPVDEHGRIVPIIIDADSEVPYEHVIGVVNALKGERLEVIEFTANPRFPQYYGSHDRSQFERPPRK